MAWPGCSRMPTECHGGLLESNSGNILYGRASSAAFFDLDRTLISGASAFPFGIEAGRQGLASGADVGRWAVAAVSFKLMGDKGGTSQSVRGDLLTGIGGSSVRALE